METLLNQAQELVASIRKNEVEVLSKSNELDKKLKEVHDLEAELKQFQKALEAREEAVKLLEAPDVILAEAKRIKAENTESLEAISNAQKGFAKERAEFNSKVQKETLELNTQKEIIKKELDEIKAMREELKEKIKNYKDEVLNKLKVSV